MFSEKSKFVESAVLAHLADLRSELVEEIPRACKLVSGLQKVHKVYLKLYKEASDVLFPELLHSELKYHIKNHFGMVLYVLDELQFLVDGKIVRSNKFKLLKAREFVHSIQKNDFNTIEPSSVVSSISLCTKSIEGYFFEEQSALSMKVTKLYSLLKQTYIVHLRT
jgi:hypothetical protein